MRQLTCFKAYDIRGRLPDELNDDIAWAIGRALADFLKPRTVIIGGDIRLSTPSLKRAISDGLRSAGTDVMDLGLCGTEEVYFATSNLKADGGVMVTASHNPMDYNGIKLVRAESKPISMDSGLQTVKGLAEAYLSRDDLPRLRQKPLVGNTREISQLSFYVDHLLGYIEPKSLRPMKLVVNAGNGAAGHVVDAIEQRFAALGVPLQFIKVHHQPDGNFPNGIPNPILPERRSSTSAVVLEQCADMGIAWDGDFDRCFFFDEAGRFIEGYYIVGLLAEAFLQHHPGAKIIHDPRLTWNTIDQVVNAGGTPVPSRTGHSYIKELMRNEDAVYGGEMSAHHYFRDFAYCDSGMIPWLLVAELMSRKKMTLSAMVAERIDRFPSSGEINSTLDNPQQAVERVLAFCSADAIEVDQTDGLSANMGNWRFNLRSSNTEPVLRLNVESRGDRALMEEKTAELLQVIRQQ